VAWLARQYVAAWMTGQAGREVRLRHMPHHEHEVEVFDARTGEHLGAAFLADQASPEQIAQVHRSRELGRRRLQADLRAAEKARRIRYAAATTAVPRSRSPRSLPRRPPPSWPTPATGSCAPRPGPR
jgi:putative transposase